jgi:hypothetical protein
VPLENKFADLRKELPWFKEAIVVHTTSIEDEG